MCIRDSDGCNAGPGTKDTRHLRRTKGLVGPKVNFVGSMPLKIKKEHFLSNCENKQRFIDMLSSKLQGHGIKTLHVESDADLLIVQTAVD